MSRWCTCARWTRSGSRKRDRQVRRIDIHTDNRHPIGGATLRASPALGVLPPPCWAGRGRLIKRQANTSGQVHVVDIGWEIASSNQMSDLNLLLLESFLRTLLTDHWTGTRTKIMQGDTLARKANTPTIFSCITEKVGIRPFHLQKAIPH